MITATPGMAPVITGSFMFFPEAALHKAASGGIVKICISIAVLIGNPPCTFAPHFVRCSCRAVAL